MDKSQNKIKLGYWKIRGKAHQIRSMLFYLGVEFEEDLYEQGDGPDFNRDCWLKVKYNLGLNFPNLPYLRHGDYNLSETAGIMVYLASKYDSSLLGKSPEDQGRLRMIDNIIDDRLTKFTRCQYTGEDKSKTLETMKQDFSEIDAWIGKERKFLVADYITYMDFFLHEAFERILWYTEGKGHEYFPNISRVWKNVDSLESMTKFKSSESYKANTKFNNKHAKVNN